MLYVDRFFKIHAIGAISTAFALSACLNANLSQESPSDAKQDSNAAAEFQADKPGKNASLDSKSPENLPVRIQGARIEQGTLRIFGSGLTGVKNLRIESQSNLAILSKTVSEIRARAASPITLIAGATYRLLVSSAHADDQVHPIVVSSGGPVFAGYTIAKNGNLGGILGANQLCDSAFPGSHWADVAEIQKLGVNFPSTHDVWINEATPFTWDRTNRGCGTWTKNVRFPEIPGYGCGFVWGPAMKATGEIDLNVDCCSQLRLACVY